MPDPGLSRESTSLPAGALDEFVPNQAGSSGHLESTAKNWSAGTRALCVCVCVCVSLSLSLWVVWVCVGARVRAACLKHSSLQTSLQRCTFKILRALPKRASLRRTTLCKSRVFCTAVKFGYDGSLFGFATRCPLLTAW